ncbi:NAD-dependent epimerase [Bacillus sp. HMF5848]|uniref:NAD-dependent epimerase n=1 Tax=Bacillus sp. HMF5848 TaxID=2495421 RepID=UPI000F7A1452|nr:NAD-dependent epimerase [Bacillus sp. HMF5848]RSK28390.1 NAD-dependent epimerase [Bacillus sp. HMF5848]
MNVLITGAAGFIGFHTAKRLLESGCAVCGVDNLNEYYDVKLKKARLQELQRFGQFTFIHADIINEAAVTKLFNEYRFSYVIHLAAQAGVRYSLENPKAYIDSNITGFLHILEACRRSEIRHLVFASSSSVYGANQKIPFSEEDVVDQPISVYAATKKSNELMAHTYSHLYKLPVTGLRFFTVYGPWGRPDMAYFSFTKRIMEGKSIQLFNYGDMLRDFTYISDIVDGIEKILVKPPLNNERHSQAPYAIYNIGHNQPVKLADFIELLQALLGREAVIEHLPMQPGDVYATYANIENLNRAIGFQPTTSIEEGLHHFVSWYKDFYETEFK